MTLLVIDSFNMDLFTFGLVYVLAVEVNRLKTRCQQTTTRRPDPANKQNPPASNVLFDSKQLVKCDQC